MAFSSYPREVMTERGAVLHELNQRELPTVSGLVIDKAGTQSHEQGLWVSPDRTTAQLHVVDSTAFAPGGATDQFGLLHVRSIHGHKATDAARQRLFQDPVLYRRLDVTNPDGCPTIQIAFRQEEGEWEVDKITRARFFAKRVVDKGSSQHINKLGNIEHELELSLGAWIDDLDTRHHLGFVKDTNGETFAHRPLREWADFKNLQLLADLMIDRSTRSMLTPGSQQRIQAHIADSERIKSLDEAAQLLQDRSSIEGDLVDILASDDITKYMMSSEAFRHFCTAILEQTVEVERIIGIGSVLGLITVEVSPAGIPLVSAGGKQHYVHDWEEFLISTLQQTNRTENATTRRARTTLGELQRRAKEQRDAQFTGEALVHTQMNRMFSAKLSRASIPRRRR